MRPVHPVRPVGSIQSIQSILLPTIHRPPPHDETAPSDAGPLDCRRNNKPGRLRLGLTDKPMPRLSPHKLPPPEKAITRQLLAEIEIAEPPHPPTATSASLWEKLDRTIKNANAARAEARRAAAASPCTPTSWRRHSSSSADQRGAAGFFCLALMTEAAATGSADVTMAPPSTRTSALAKAVPELKMAPRLEASWGAGILFPASCLEERPTSAASKNRRAEEAPEAGGHKGRIFERASGNLQVNLTNCANRVICCRRRTELSSAPTKSDLCALNQISHREG